MRNKELPKAAKAAQKAQKAEQWQQQFAAKGAMRIPRGVDERTELPHKQEAKRQVRNIVAMELNDACVGDAGGKN